MGEMLDRAATLWRTHFKPLFLLSFGFSLVNFIAMKFTVLSGQRLTPMLYASDVQAEAQRDPNALLGQTGVSLGLWMVLCVFLFWSYWLATLATSRYVVSSQLGEPVSPADGLRRALSRVLPLTGAYLLSMVWAALMTVLMLLPAALFAGMAAAAASFLGSSTLAVVLGVIAALLTGLGTIAAMLWYFLRFLLLPPVMAMEDLGALDAFKRSGELLSGRIGPGFLGRVMVRAMILYTVMSLILISLQLVSSIPSWLVMSAYGNPFQAATMARTPQLLLVPAELLQVVAQSCITPVYFVFCSLFYLDMRVRREALDLERRMDAPEATPTLAV